MSEELGAKKIESTQRQRKEKTNLNTWILQSLDRIDARLRRVEYLVWFACGGIVVGWAIGGSILWFIAKAFLSNFTIVPK